MGTRGAWGFRIDGADKVTYNHFDSYPDGLGDNLVSWLRKKGGRFGKLTAEARSLRVIDRKARPTEEEKVRLRPFADLGVSGQSLDDWYCLLRETQGYPDRTLDAGVMIDSHEFLRDSLFCEWAYIVNLDDGLFEVYRGFQREPHDKGRYAALPLPDDAGKDYQTGKPYQPVALVAQYPLDDIPGDWVRRVSPSEEDE